MTGSDPITIVLIDDHPVVLAGLRDLLGGMDGLVVVGDYLRGREGLEAVKLYEPSVVILDYHLPDCSALDLLTKLRRDHSRVRRIVLSGMLTDEQVVGTLAHGANGVLFKDSTPELLAECIRSVVGGGTWIAPDIAVRALAKKSDQATEGAADLLSERELIIARLVARGLRNKEIARELAITEGTVKVHVNHIFRKLNVRSRVALSRRLAL
jgi:two-component system nitrate/nitrite response regulator NarL